MARLDRVMTVAPIAPIFAASRMRPVMSHLLPQLLHADRALTGSSNRSISPCRGDLRSRQAGKATGPGRVIRAWIDGRKVAITVVSRNDSTFINGVGGCGSPAR